MSKLRPCGWCGKSSVKDELTNILCGNSDCILFNYRMSAEAWQNRPAENQIKADGMQMVLDCRELNLSEGEIDTIKLMQDKLKGTR